MTYRSWLPHGIGPTGEAREALASARARLMRAVEMQAHYLRARITGTATERMRERMIENKHLSRVLAGPRGDSDIIDRRSGPRRGDRQATNI
jgi:hypothetical protein